MNRLTELRRLLDDAVAPYAYIEEWDALRTALDPQTICYLLDIVEAAAAVGPRWYETDEMKTLAAALAPLLKEADSE